MSGSIEGGMGGKLRQKLWLTSQPLMEVADIPAGVNISATARGRYRAVVTKSYEADSPVVAEVRPYTKLRVLSTRVLPDNSRRACVILDGDKKPLGWITSTSATGRSLIHIYARPLYEVIAPPKVRKTFEMSSRFVTQLPIGTRLHVVETRRTEDAVQRACVMLVGEEDKPVGWITVMKLGVRGFGFQTIREIGESGPCLASYRRTWSSPPRSAEEREAIQKHLQSERRKELLRRSLDGATYDHELRVSLTPRGPLTGMGVSSAGSGAAGSNGVLKPQDRGRRVNDRGFSSSFRSSSTRLESLSAAHAKETASIFGCRAAAGAIARASSGGTGRTLRRSSSAPISARRPSYDKPTIARAAEKGVNVGLQEVVPETITGALLEGQSLPNEDSAKDPQDRSDNQRADSMQYMCEAEDDESSKQDGRMPGDDVLLAAAKVVEDSSIECTELAEAARAAEAAATEEVVSVAQQTIPAES